MILNAIRTISNVATIIIEIVQMSDISLSSCSASSSGCESNCVPGENGSLSKSASTNSIFGKRTRPKRTIMM
jgi:hypothetical protein